MAHFMNIHELAGFTVTRNCLAGCISS